MSPRASAPRDGSVPSAFSFIVMVLTTTWALAPTTSAQLPTITASPPSGTKYPPGHQMTVRVEFCSPSSSFDMSGYVYVNGDLVGYGSPGSQGGCFEFQTADVPVTLNGATTTVTGYICNVQGCTTQDFYYYTPPDPPTVYTGPPSTYLGPHNGYNRNLGLCFLECFNSTVGYSTPSYVSFDAPRSVTLWYSSGQVQSRHTVQVDVVMNAAVAPEKLSLRLRRSDGSYVTFTNGSTEIFYQGQNGTSRLAAQFEDTMLATGAHDYTAVARAHWSTTVQETGAPLRLLVINERASPYGAGWSLAGLQRIKFGPGDSVSTWDGAGTIQFWRRGSCTSGVCPYSPPAGEFDSLSYTLPGYRGASPEIAYRRRLLDASRLSFDDQGRLLYADDPFGNRTTFVWLDADRLQQVVDPAGKTITFGYTSGKLAWIRDDPGQRTTLVTIDAANHVTQIQDPAGGKPFQQATYDSFDRLRSLLDRRGGDWRYGYDFGGKLAADSAPPVTIYGQAQPYRLVTGYKAPELAALVDPASGLGTSANPAPVTTAPDVGQVQPTTGTGAWRDVKVDAFGAVLSVKQSFTPFATLALIARDPNGLVTSAWDSTGQGTYTWSGPRLMKEKNEFSRDSVLYEWNVTYHRVTRRYGNLPETRAWIGLNGRVDSARVGYQPSTRFAYDALGRVTTVTDPRGHVRQYFYATTGFRNTDSVRTGTRKVRFAYDTLGRVVKTVNPRGDADTVIYDVLNRVREERGPQGHRVTYGYTDSLNLTAVTDALGQVYRTEKNLLGWDTAVVDPGNRVDRYTYNRVGQVREWTNRRGQVTTSVWDEINSRLTQRTLADGRQTTYTYSETARTTVATNAEGSDTLRWARDTSWAIAVRGGVAHAVRTRGDSTNRWSVATVWRSGQTQYEMRYDIDSLGRVWKMQPTGWNPDTLVYDTDGRLVGVKWHGVASAARAGRPGHELARVSYTDAAGALQSAVGAEFAHDSLSRVAEHVNGNRDQFEKYTYDALARLTAYERRTASPPCAPTDTLHEFGARCTSPGSILAQASYSYDSVGNRVDASTVVNAGNRITSLAGYALEYDLDGNVTRKYWTTDSAQFNQRLYWNSVSQPDSVRTTVAGGGTTTTKFGYDGFGRRVRKRVGTQTTWYVWQGQQVVAEYDSATGALQRHYTYYPGTDRPHSLGTTAARYYFLTDGRGNVGGLMNSGGSAVVAQYRYTPFGDSAYTSGTLANNVRFAGRELDPETKLYYNRARYYDPKLGRFLSEDPIGLAGGINQYAYAGNDPVNARDPSGLYCERVSGTYSYSAGLGIVVVGYSYYVCDAYPLPYDAPFSVLSYGGAFNPHWWGSDFDLRIYEGMSGGLPADPTATSAPGDPGVAFAQLWRPLRDGVEVRWDLDPQKGRHLHVRQHGRQFGEIVKRGKVQAHGKGPSITGRVLRILRSFGYVRLMPIMCLGCEEFYELHAPDLHGVPLGG
jgi:RHS repeat-associated protein